MRRRFPLVLGIIAAVLYNNWLLGPWLDNALWMHNGSVSEFSVTAQPAHLAFRMLDIAAGLLLIYLGYWLLKASSGQIFGKLLAGFTGLLGFSNILDALFVLPCSQTLSSACSVPLSLSLHHLQIPAHAYSSSLIGLCYFFAPLFGLIYAYQAKLRRLAVFSALIVIDSVYSLVATLVEYFRNGGPTTKANGASQELEMAMIGIWLVICVWEVSRSSKMVTDVGH